MNPTLIFCILVSISLIQSAVILPPQASNSKTHFESLYRDLVGKNNRERIQLLNSQSSKFKLAENQFINLAEQQFRALYLGARIPNKTQTSVVSVQAPVTQFSIDYSSDPTFGGGDYSYGGGDFGVITTDYLNVDWNRDGKLTSVKNQGNCGSCWAFTAISDLQSSLIMNGHPRTIDLSEQQLVDCSSMFGNTGCSGGWAVNAFNYMTKYPVTLQANYPYVGSTSSCKLVVNDPFKIRDVKVYQNNTNCQILLDVLKIRPLTVAVAADPLFWAFYQSGVLDRCPGQINHAVVLSGVKADPFDNYWIIKNSWGAAWGENGFMRIDRSQNNGNTCQICSYPAYSTAL